MIDINEFDAIRIGLASSKQIRDWSSGEVTKPETINYRTLKPERDGLFCERIFGPTKDWECYCGKYKRVRYKGIICERCGVEVTRQKVRRERMGHIDLAAPVSHIWFFKGVPSRIGYLLDIAPRELEKVLYFAASIVTTVDVAKRKKDLNDLESKVEAEKERIDVDRDEALAALEDRLKRRREFFTKGKERNFDEDDEFWTRGLSNWAEEQGIPPLEEARELVYKLFVEVANKITTEDSKKIRELVRNSAIRDDRRLTPKELETVATVAIQIREALKGLYKELAKATGSKKGALTKHINRVLDGLLVKKAKVHEDDLELVSSIDEKQLEKARDLGKGLLREVLEQAEPAASADDIRELTNDLCLRTDGKIQKEDLDAIVQWSLKVREMYLDIESRRQDAREAAEDSKQRLADTWDLFKELEPKQIIGDEQLFRELKDRFGSTYGFDVYFTGGMGAEAIRELLKDLGLDAEAASLRETIKTSKGQKQQRAIKRLKVVNAFIKSENRPEWMVLEAIPVIPPELRPMVQLDGGRFATSDLNDLYRRVINRNNRLKRLLDLGAPEIIVNNEKRMLQEAVDALFDNGRRGRAVTGPGNRPLKSLSDMLKGKQGRFRQNLLGKRVDYSGRSVIVSGPYLKLHQCGLPKIMALELFKPFIMSRLVDRKSVQNIKAAKKYVDSMTPEVWDVLEEVIAEHPVLLNRAPTLHRLGIQAFEPVLVEGKAIQVHPLVCHAFNADFDGDQMAVHLPLSAEAQAEARLLMLSSNNILSPANGRPLTTPGQDMVLGGYFLTYSEDDLTKATVEKMKPRPKRLQSETEVEMALDAKQIKLQEPIEYRWHGELILTTPGRVIFNSEVERSLMESYGEEKNAEPPEFINHTLSKREMDDLISALAERYGAHGMGGVLDTIKTLGFKYATEGGITISKNDIVVPPEKGEILARYEARVVHGRGAVRARPHHRGGAPRADRDHLDRGDRRGRRRHAEDAVQAEPDLHDGQLGSPWILQADPPARRYARPDGESEGRDHRAPDPGQLHGGPVGARVLHLDPRRPQGARRHRAAHGRLRVPDAASRRRRPGRDHPRGQLQDEGLHRRAAARPRRPEQEPPRAHAGRRGDEAALEREAGQDEARGQGRDRDGADARRDHRGVRRAGPGVHAPRALGAQVPQRVRRVPRVLRDLPRHRKDLRHRRRGRHHRRPVDRRAGHPAHHADLPHGRCRRRGHHARPPARRRDLRGTKSEGRGQAGRGLRARRHRADRPRSQGDDRPRREGPRRRGAGADRLRAPAADAPARHQGTAGRAGRSSPRGLALTRRAPRAACEGRQGRRRRPSCISCRRSCASTSRRASTSTTSTSS